MVKEQNGDLYPSLKQQCHFLETQFGQVLSHRKAALQPLIDYTLEGLKHQKPIHLLVVCTHNARRSQMGQCWWAAGAAYYGLTDMVAHSGGTETTALHPNTAAALRRAGFACTCTEPTAPNPIYHIQWNATGPGLKAYSKIYHQTLPNGPFAALLVCQNESCPLIPEAHLKINLPYQDPGALDGTSTETQAYDQTMQAIGVELLWALQQVKTAL